MLVRMLRGMAVGAGAALGLAMIAPAVAQAQAQKAGTRFGVEGAFGTQHIGIGAGAFIKFHLLDVSEHPITGRVTFDYFFPSSGFYGGTTHYWEIAGDGLFDIATASAKTKPYLAAGLTYWHYSFPNIYCGVLGGGCASTSSTNLHVAGGINFMANAKLMPFLEAKFELGNGSALIIKGGVHF